MCVCVCVFPQKSFTITGVDGKDGSIQDRCDLTCPCSGVNGVWVEVRYSPHQLAVARLHGGEDVTAHTEDKQPVGSHVEAHI